jgi:hypothetical protein
VRKKEETRPCLLAATSLLYVCHGPVVEVHEKTFLRKRGKNEKERKKREEVRCRLPRGEFSRGQGRNDTFFFRDVPRADSLLKEGVFELPIEKNA